MAEELHYSTVVFKNPIVSSPKEKKEEETEYDEVKAKGSAVTQRNPATAVDEKSALHSQPFRGAAVCLGLLCALLVSAIIGLCVYFSTTNRRLAVEKENVSRERDRLNWNLQLIFQFDVFPVKKYCSHKVGTGERVCNSCQDGWMLFQSSCYLIVQPEAQWKTWTESQQYCKQENADLPVIGSQAEQEFIHNHTKDYYDDYHGYWIGLTDKAENGKWLWVNGSHQNLTDGFWNSRNGGNCVLTIPKNAPLANWNAVSCDMQNRWICESRALIWPD